MVFTQLLISLLEVYGIRYSFNNFLHNHVENVIRSCGMCLNLQTVFLYTVPWASWTCSNKIKLLGSSVQNKSHLDNIGYYCLANVLLAFLFHFISIMHLLFTTKIFNQILFSLICPDSLKTTKYFWLCVFIHLFWELTEGSKNIDS